MTIYEDERVIVTSTNNQSKVTIADKFAPVASMSLNRAAFESMCKAIAEKVKEREAAE